MLESSDFLPEELAAIARAQQETKLESARGKIVMRWLVARHMNYLIANLDQLALLNTWMLAPHWRQQEMECIWLCKQILGHTRGAGVGACSLLLTHTFLGD